MNPPHPYRTESPDSVLHTKPPKLFMHHNNNLQNERIINYNYQTQESNNQLDKSLDLQTKLNAIIQNYDSRLEKLSKNSRTNGQVNVKEHNIQNGLNNAIIQYQVSHLD
eukprot:TRINITY_DN24855_c1_g1_i5.p3 TRINITY_DN24855_c1_g1~~TRINITY_DN24855_c1_g1_i5.p3  ORF type:complete len:109 (-),score=1.57 TRINITY_DN24855_c1_g1_i5:9-335(-)